MRSRDGSSNPWKLPEFINSALCCSWMVENMVGSTICMAVDPVFVSSQAAIRLSALRLLPSGSLRSSTRFKRRMMVLRPAKCCSEQQEQQPSSPPSVSSSTFAWCAGLGALGFLETGYLTYLKLTNSDAFCPIGGGGCSDVLNSDYATVAGAPLPLIGMVAYGLVASIGFCLARKELLPGVGATDGRLVLLAVTTSMAAASGYFLYLLSTKLAGTSCSYCVISVILSFSLFFITLKEFELEEIQKVGGLQLALAGLVIAALTTSYNISRPELTSLADIDLQPFEPEITTESSPLAISLANHLHSVGAKMYGAFWCSHCLEQKQMFGREAAKIVDYVECFPNGYRKGVKVAKACEDAGIEGFPTWVIKGQVLSGETEFEELAQASGFALDDFHPK